MAYPFGATKAVVAAAFGVMLGIGVGPATGDAIAPGSATLACAVAEIITGTNGRVEHRQLRQFVRIDAGVYQVWEEPASRWGANLCDVSTCSWSAGVFQLVRNYSSQEGGYKLSHQEQRTVDLRGGHATSRIEEGTTLLVTGYEVETTTYDEGECLPSSDPERHPGND